jgi:hypothetical protein
LVGSRHLGASLNRSSSTRPRTCSISCWPVSQSNPQANYGKSPRSIPPFSIMGPPLSSILINRRSFATPIITGILPKWSLLGIRLRFSAFSTLDRTYPDHARNRHRFTASANSPLFLAQTASRSGPDPRVRVSGGITYSTRTFSDVCYDRRLTDAKFNAYNDFRSLTSIHFR